MTEKKKQIDGRIDLSGGGFTFAGMCRLLKQEDHKVKYKMKSLGLTHSQTIGRSRLFSNETVEKLRHAFRETGVSHCPS